MYKYVCIRAYMWENEHQKFPRGAQNEKDSLEYSKVHIYKVVNVISLKMQPILCHKHKKTHLSWIYNEKCTCIMLIMLTIAPCMTLHLH